MLAGGVTFAIPGVMPAVYATHNGNLFVSAENSQFDNYMAGPMVIEVVVIDSDISDTNDGKGEPDVTVQSKSLRMAQATDGNWYGYFANVQSAQAADATQPEIKGPGYGLNFGHGCDANSATIAAGVTLSQTKGVYFPRVISGSTETPGQLSADCVKPKYGAELLSHVIRENKTLNVNPPFGIQSGQIDVNDSTWPFIQLYDLTPTSNVNISYNKAGGAQETILTFDTVDQFANLGSDRSVFPNGASVHLTMTDLQLNIDPTDEDSWTWATLAKDNAVYYQLYDENGFADADGTVGAVDIKSALKGEFFMFEDNGILLIDLDTQNSGTEILRIVDNGDSNTNGTENVKASTVSSGVFGNGTIKQPNQPVTFTELQANSGILTNYDNNDDANLQISENAPRGVSASIDYNETPKTILVGFGFGTIDIQPIDDEWNSGEEIPLVLVDTDVNLNSRIDEDLDVDNPDVSLIPSLETGNPFTLGETAVEGDTLEEAVYTTTVPTFTAVRTADAAYSTIGFPTGGINATAQIDVNKFSHRAVLTANQTLTGTHALVIDLEVKAKELFESITDTSGSDPENKLHGFNLFNQDLRSLNQTGQYFVYLLNNTSGEIIDNSTNDAANSSYIVPGITGISIVNTTDVNTQSLNLINSTNRTPSAQTAQDIIFDNIVNAIFSVDANDRIGLLWVYDVDTSVSPIVATGAGYELDKEEAMVADFFSFGFNADGDESGERVANQLIRIEVEESGDNTSTFKGSLEYTMVNQLNILDADLYTSLSPISDDPNFIVIEDLTDEDSPRVNYLDLGADGVYTQIADQEEAPSHSGTVSFDNNSYKTADTVTITVKDLDLNTDSDLVDIYTTVVSPPSASDEPLLDVVGESELPTGFSFGDLGRLLDVRFNDKVWKKYDGSACEVLLDESIDGGLGETEFTLVETSRDSGTFVGDFQIPSKYCPDDGTSTTPITVTGLDIKTNYVDFRDASGEIIKVSDKAGVRASTGSVSLDRTVYPVPFGVPSDFAEETSTATPAGRSIFPIHATGLASQNTGTQEVHTIGDVTGEFIATGDLALHIRVNDPDFDISAQGEDVIAENTAKAAVGPVKISVIRGSNTIVLGYAGGPAAINGVIDVKDTFVQRIFANTPEVFADVNGNGERDSNDNLIRQFGPMVEIAPTAGIFEIDVNVRYTDGPADSKCPITEDFTPLNGANLSGDNLVTDRFSQQDATNPNQYCILQGDILQVEYTDPADASGDVNTVTDSATFDLRNGVLQSDKSVYIIGSDMIMTLIEPDFDLDNDGAETYNLDLIEWDSDAATITMGQKGGSENVAAFDPEPSNFRETGDSTGIFQIVVEIPKALSKDNLERGEEAILEYTDWGPSGSDFVGDEDEDVNLTIFTSNFGATVELDQKVYSWTDKVYITIVAPDHNFDGDLVDEIGSTDLDPIKVSTRGFNLKNYKLVETGTDTGIFTGEVILTGFPHDADGKGNLVDTNPRTSEAFSGPTDGLLESSDDDGLTISFEFSEDETIVGSSLIRWNIGEVQWLEASYPASGTGVVRVIDPDMNLDPEAVDNFSTDVWSDSDAGGIDLTVTETNEATGIFEGTVFFTTTDESSGHRLRVAEGDTVTAEYEDNTLPDPYTRADELDVTATSLIGTVVPPLERAPAANLRTVDAFGNSLDTISVDQQVQISADLSNGQNREQQFAYLVQIQDGNGVTVSLAWITGSLSTGQSFSPALSWIPTEAGSYTATAFVWESVDNPTALSPPVTTTITVQ
jgi:hypothetical protein